MYNIKFFLLRTREQRISDSGNSTTSSGENVLENGAKNNIDGRKRSVASTASISSNKLSNGTIIDNIVEDDFKSFNLEEITSTGSTGNTEITSLKNGTDRREEHASVSIGDDFGIDGYAEDLSYQDKLHANVRRLSNTVS